MTTIKNPLARSSPLPCLNPVRTSTPLKPALLTFQPILPDIVSQTVLKRTHPKKRVRFALTLEPVEEDSSPPSPDQEKSLTLTTIPNKRVIDPWRSNGPLYGAYVEYLDQKDCLPSETADTNRPRTPEPPVESSSSYTHTFLIQSKSPDIVIDSITVSTPTRHLPRIVQRTKSTKKIIRKPSSPPNYDSYLKQPTNSPIPPRPIQTKKFTNSVHNRQPTIKRADLILPSIKSPNSNEKIIQTDQPLGTKIVNEYLQSTKKLTEIIANPLPGTNNQISYLCGHSILPNLSKTSYHNQITNEPYFFQTHNNDHFQPIIH